MIFYFSGTGNTRWLAKQLAQATGDSIVNIAEAIVNDKYEYSIGPEERIGFCFPIHGWRPPFLVRDFVKYLKIDGYSGQFCYAFATCGDDVGLAFDYLTEDLKSIGIKLDSVFSTIMPETYNFPIIDQIDTPESAEKKISDASKRLALLLPAIVERRRCVKEINASRWPRTNSVILGSYFLKNWVTDSKFTVDSDACQRCGLCSKVCPVNNIQCTDSDVPKWLHNGLCTTCFSCYHHCPVHAIDFANRTKGKKRQYYFKG